MERVGRQAVYSVPSMDTLYSPRPMKLLIPWYEE